MKISIATILSLSVRAAPLVLASSVASAYVGPGAGLSALGSILALVGSFALLIVGFLWYPIKRVLKGSRATEPDLAQDSSREDQTQSRQSEQTEAR